MKSPTTVRQGLASLVLALGGALSAQAAPTIYQGYDPSANGLVNPTGAPVIARTDFLTRLSSSTTESFGEFSATTVLPVPPLSIFASAATLSQANGAGGRVENIQQVGNEFPGRFNTSLAADSNPDTLGAWWQSTGEFVIAFNSSISAFGFFATDLGDFDGTLTLQRKKAGAAVGGPLAVGGGIQPLIDPNATLLFFGFIDDVNDFDTIVFSIGQSATSSDEFDVIGFDDLITGPLKQGDPNGNGVPEPASSALAALSLGLLALVHRRRRRA